MPRALPRADSSHPIPEKTPRCPYCHGTRLIKKGRRRNKYEEVPLHRCQTCHTVFSPPQKHRTFPFPVILDALDRYDRLHSADEVALALSRRYRLPVRERTVRQWIADFRPVLPITRYRAHLKTSEAKRRDAGIPGSLLLESRLLHGLTYDFKFHRGKMSWLLEKDRNRRFSSLRDFLDRVPRECPHDLFRENSRKKRRASQEGGRFRIDDTTIVARENLAPEMARFVLPSVTRNKDRHAAVQRFMLVHDATTVAVEVPITLTADDVTHFRNRLGFDCPLDIPEETPITGHIDLVQIRNGKIYILDYKPGAESEKPITQLMIYALALSRRLRLPLAEFLCAWFDDRHYWEFYPLPVVHKQSGGIVLHGSAGR